MITHRAEYHLGRSGRARAIARLRPGDLVFVWPAEAMVPLIPLYQERQGYPQRACGVSHVALYVGAGEVVHATPPCILRQDLDDAFGDRSLSLATWGAGQSAAEHPGQRAAVIRDALGQQGRPYEMMPSLRQVMAEWLPGRPQRGGMAPLVCSTFLADVFRNILGPATPLHHPSIPLRAPFVTPAHLFVQPGLTEV